jgi:hypothetical protein
MHRTIGCSLKHCFFLWNTEPTITCTCSTWSTPQVGVYLFIFIYTSAKGSRSHTGLLQAYIEI